MRLWFFETGLHVYPVKRSIYARAMRILDAGGSLMEAVDRAAVRKGGVVYDVPRPGRHGDAILKAHRALGLSSDPMEPLVDFEQGFVTSGGRFVDRYEAAKLARAAGQLKADLGQRRLYSEDVW